MRLIVFGDSFSEPHEHDWIWTKQLSQFDSVINHAIGGSSIEYSINKFYEYFENDYKATDKIIFTLTDRNRAPLVHKEYNPQWASYINTLDLKQTTGRNDKGIDITEDHYEDYLEYYKTVLRYTDPKTNYYKYFIILSMLNNLDNDVIVLPCFETFHSNLKLKDNVILTKLPLIDISKAEVVIDDNNDVSWIFPNLDFRPNHMLPDNHKIFADTITKCFATKQDNFKLADFKQNVISKRNAHKFMWIKVPTSKADHHGWSWNKMFDRNQ